MSNFKYVVAMNKAFGNKGAVVHHDDPFTPIVSRERLRKQCLNIADELGELYVALGGDEELIKQAVASLKWAASKIVRDVDLDKTRDALGDIHVFAYGGHHFLGINADDDMTAILDGVMSRFIKNEDDKRATIALHAAKGVTDVYFEGQYPSMIMKSGSDQPDAPKGKFLKAASFHEPIFKQVDLVFAD